MDNPFIAWKFWRHRVVKMIISLLPPLSASNIKCYFNTSCFRDEWLQVALLQRGPSFPLHSRVMISLGQQITWPKNWPTPVEHLTGGANKQLLNWFLWFHQNSFLKNSCHPGLCPLSPLLSETFRLLVFPFVLLTQTAASGMLCAFIGCWFSILWDVFSQTLELLTCFSHFSPSLSLPPCSFPPQENQGKLTRSRTGEIELYYFSFGSLTLLPLSESYHFLHLLARVLIDQWPLNAYADQ